MFKTDNLLTFFFWNLLFGCFLFWMFFKLGWITQVIAMPLWQLVIIIGFINLFTGIGVGLIYFVASPIITIIGCCTLGIGLIGVNAFAKFAVLWLTASLTGLILFSNPFFSWPSLIIGLAFGFLHFNYSSGSRK